MNCVFIVPTGIGCSIGGHAGDATPAARLIASICDNIILHPNVVNASDINEIPQNALYVEGGLLDRFLAGEFGLKKILSNKVLVAVNAPVKNEVVNCVSAARATLGIDAEIIELNTALFMRADIDSENNCAIGHVCGVDDLITQLKDYKFDAIAINTPIEVDYNVAKNYAENGGVNPWGKVEAIASRLISSKLNKPVAHAPCGTTLEDYNEVVDPRMSAEFVSICYLFCVLKGLHKAPRICYVEDADFAWHNIDCLVSPCNCWGPPHEACYKNNIPIIFVQENKPEVKFNFTDCEIDKISSGILVNNYFEAAGVLLAMREGLCISSIRRPLSSTNVYRSIKR